MISIEGELNASNYSVFLQHAGNFSVSALTQHPSWTDATFPIADVAVLKLESQVTGIDPTEIDQTDPSPFAPGEPGTIVGFGLTLGSNDDLGIKRVGTVETVDCDPQVAGAGNEELICWNYATPVGPPGDDSNTCSGDSGGPLFMDLGAGEVVAGVTSGGSALDCDVFEHSYDANIYTYRSFVLAQLGADSTSACGSFAPVGDPGTSLLASQDGSLGIGNVEDRFSFEVSSSRDELRVTLNHVFPSPFFDADLYVRFGAPPTTEIFDCRPFLFLPYEACNFASPANGIWCLLIDHFEGSGDYQVTATEFGGAGTVPPIVCASLDKQETKCANSINKGAAKVAKAISKIKTSDCPGGATCFLPELKTCSSEIGEIMKQKDLDLIDAIFGPNLDASIVKAEDDKPGAGVPGRDRQGGGQVPGREAVFHPQLQEGQAQGWRHRYRGLSGQRRQWHPRWQGQDQQEVRERPRGYGRQEVRRAQYGRAFPAPCGPEPGRLSGPEDWVRGLPGPERARRSQPGLRRVR